jgi:hypothetical protein
MLPVGVEFFKRIPLNGLHEALTNTANTSLPAITLLSPRRGMFWRLPAASACCAQVVQTIKRVTYLVTVSLQRIHLELNTAPVSGRCVWKVFFPSVFALYPYLSPTSATISAQRTKLALGYVHSTNRFLPDSVTSQIHV